MNMILNTAQKSRFRKTISGILKRHKAIEESMLNGEASMKDTAVVLYLSDVPIMHEALQALYNAIIFIESENQGMVQKLEALPVPDKFMLNRSRKISGHANECFTKLDKIGR